jgi:hypothetical protein
MSFDDTILNRGLHSSDMRSNVLPQHKGAGAPRKKHHRAGLAITSEVRAGVALRVHFSRAFFLDGRIKSRAEFPGISH